MTKSYVKMINAPSNLFHFQFPIFKNSLSGVHTFLKLDTCQYFTSKGFQKTKTNSYKSHWMYFKKSFIQHLLYVFRAFNTLDLLNQLNLQMQEWNFAKPKCEYFFLISYLAYLHYLLIKFGTKLQWDQMLKKKKKSFRTKPRQNSLFLLHAAILRSPGPKTHFKARYVNIALKKPVAFNFFWLPQHNNSFWKSKLLTLHFMDLRYIKSFWYTPSTP